MIATATASSIVQRSSCPVCGRAAVTTQGTKSPEVAITLADHVFTQPPGFVQQCLSCGILFRDAIPSDESLASYYRHVDYHVWETTGTYPTEDASLKILRTLPAGARILDFGCSTGRLLANLVDTYDCYGYEINTEAAAEAAAKGLTILSEGDLARNYHNSFDAVVMMDVFEHLSDPLSVLRPLFQLLKPAGMILIVTGNGDSPACYRDPANFWYFLCIGHICMLTRKHADYLADKLEAKIETWQELCHYEHSWQEKLRQVCQDFAYWQFQKQTFLARTFLPLIPFLHRAKHWAAAPALTCTRDHVLLTLRKTSIV